MRRVSQAGKKRRQEFAPHQLFTLFVFGRRLKFIITVFKPVNIIIVQLTLRNNTQHDPSSPRELLRDSSVSQHAQRPPAIVPLEQ